MSTWTWTYMIVTQDFFLWVVMIVGTFALLSYYHSTHIVPADLFWNFKLIYIAQNFFTHYLSLMTYVSFTFIYLTCTFYVIKAENWNIFIWKVLVNYYYKSVKQCSTARVSLQNCFNAGVKISTNYSVITLPCVVYSLYKVLSWGGNFTALSTKRLLLVDLLMLYMSHS